MIPYGTDVCPEDGELICELCAGYPHNVHQHGTHGVTLRLSDEEADDLLDALRFIVNLEEVHERLGEAIAYWKESLGE
jgi:hypothetical protein